ncbi:MFS transporter [Sphingobium sp.]|uniref:MFS transporter n=1 Tax=Sphingobium sp. TaxID=1912891 RepID=UPI0028BE635F|nr:MFS transporter [Sphingobium sp.]
MMTERSVSETLGRGPPSPGDQSAPARRRQGIAIMLCALLAVSEGFCLPSIGLTGASLMREIKLAQNQFGLSITVMLAGFFIGTSCGGVMGDRHGRNRMVLCTFLIVALFWSVGATTSRFSWLLISRFAVGLGLGAAFPNLIALAAAQVSPQVRGRAIAIVTGGGAVGGLSAAVMIVFGAGTITWRGVYWAAALLAALFLPFFTYLVPDCREIDPDSGQFRIDLRKILIAEGRLPVTLLLACANFCLAFNMNAIASWSPVLLGARGLSDQTIGFATAMVGPCAMLANFSYATLFDRGFRKASATIAGLGSVPALIFFFAAQTPIAALLAMGSIGLTVIAGQLLLFSIVPACYPPEARATSLGAAMAASRLGAIVAPITLGFALRSGVSQAGLLAFMLPAAGIALMCTLFVLGSVFRRRAPDL